MDKKIIGENAKKVLMLLHNNCRWSYNELKERSHLSDRDLNAAIGWLAREGKIEFEMDDITDTLFLSINIYIG